MYTDENGRQYLAPFDMPKPINHIGPWTRDDRHPRDYRYYPDEHDSITIPGWLPALLLGLACGFLTGRLSLR